MTPLRKTFWYATGVGFWLLGLGLTLDMGVFFFDEHATWTARLQEYFHGSPVAVRSFLVGQFFGMLLVHVTRWGKTPDQTTRR